MIIKDGIYYDDETSVPDLASWCCATIKGAEDNLEIREYYGLSLDLDKLPTYKNLSSGSTAYCTDTGQLYMYERTTQQWIEQ